ncbi:MAG: UbiA family prenyltransferase [Henriciella sp.]
MSSKTLVLDLDGTLVRNDLTHELLILCLRWKPHLLLIALVTLFRSKSDGKRFLAERFGEKIEAKHLPYQQAVLDLMEDHRSSGAAIEIVSGSDELLVRKIADHVGVDFHKGSTPGQNLTSISKAKFLVERHGSNFIYVGNSTADYAIWQVADRGYGVDAPSGAYNLSRDDGSKAAVTPLVEGGKSIRPLIKAMRLHQWAKNLLLFLVPALFISSLTAISVIQLIAAFLCFSFLASSTYILNDLFDIPDDRAHRTKHKRPLASGRLSIPLAVLMIGLTVPVTFVLSYFISSSFSVILIAYAFATIAYSFRLKRLPIIDVFVLAGLFTGRVVAGAYVINEPPSGWLLAFIGSFFLALAIGKRYIEVRNYDADDAIPGRGYYAADKPILLNSGISAGFASVISLLIYGLLAPSVLFNFEISIFACATILTSWLMRFWLLAGRGQINDDPVIFAIKDKTSFLTLMLIGLIFLFDITRPFWSNQN